MKKPEAFRKENSSQIPLWMRRLFKIRTRMQAFYIFLILISGILSISLLIIFSLGPMTEAEFDNVIVDPNDLNSYFIPKQENVSFHYPNLFYQNNSNCIDRNKYKYDYLRLFGFQPGETLVNNSYIIVFGAETAVGKEVIKQLNKKHLKYIKWPRADTFGAYFQTKELFKEEQIRGAIVVDQPYNEKTTYLYYKGICELLSSFQKPFEIMLLPPYSKYLIDMLKWYGAHIVYLPSFFDGETYDLNNQLIRSRFECQTLKKTSIMKDTDYFVIKPKDIAKHLIEQLLSIEPEHIALRSASSGSVEYAVNKAIADFPDCQIVEKMSDLSLDNSLPQPIEVGGQSNRFGKELDKALKNLPTRNYSDHYLTIVTYGETPKDDDEKELMQNWLDYIDFTIGNLNINWVDIIIVDLSKEKDKQLSKILIVGENLKGKVRFIEYPLSGDSNYKTKFSAWNIGIRRSKSDFILTCSMDDILSQTFFEELTPQLLDKRIIYTVSVWIAEKLSNIPKGFTFGTLSGNKYAGERCRVSGNGLKLIYQGNQIHDLEWCGFLDSIIMSKDLWHVMGGFPEFSADLMKQNMEQIIKMRFMRMIPGILESTLRAPVLKIIREFDEENPQLIDSWSITNEYVCHGYSSQMEKYENPNWGFNGYGLLEEKF